MPTQIEKYREWDEWIEKAFAAMDKSGSGRLSREDLAAYLCKDGMCLSEDALRQALAEAHRACGDAMTLEVQNFQTLSPFTPVFASGIQRSACRKRRCGRRWQRRTTPVTTP